MAARDETDIALGERVARRLPALLWALCVAFSFFAGVTLVVRPPGATAPLAAIDITGAVLLAAAALVAGRRGVGGAHANGVAAAALLLTLGASLAAIKLLHLPAQTTNVLLVVLVASFVLLSARWHVVVLVAAVAGWALVAWSEGIDAAWLNAGFALVASTVMSATIQLVRLRDARRYEALRARDHARVQALASANQALEEFAFVVSHDLKEPIRATRFLLAEAREATSEAERAELVARAAESHARLERLVQGLLEWSRASTTPLEPVEVDVGALLADGTTRALFERALAERGGTLVVEPGLPAVMGTPALVRQVLGNLILNAVKHNDKPAPRVEVRAAPDAPPGNVVLLVEDDGPGFPAALLAGPAARATGPSGGFGLQVARRAVERLGGTLTLANGSRGASARIRLPAPAQGARRPVGRVLGI